MIVHNEALSVSALCVFLSLPSKVGGEKNDFSLIVEYILPQDLWKYFHKVLVKVRVSEEMIGSLFLFFALEYHPCFVLKLEILK